ncbi:MAG: DUF6288 domain-containing protein [Phycisphaeraceae bacterium]
MLRFVMICTLLFGLLPGSAGAVYEKQDGFPWNLTLHGDHDKPIAEALPNGSFFMNVGPTGIRAQITHAHPAFFTVKFVFDKSPAAGKVKPGDIIVGANGQVMGVPHRFGRRNVTGWDGPMQEMARLIEDSQGKDGELELIVWPGGERSAQKKVTLKLEPVGRFSDTFPFDCPRSDKLMQELCDFLANEYQRTGKFGRQHVHNASLLALLASGENKYTPVIERAMAGYPGKRYSSLNGTGYQCWTFGLDGIVIGEYYLLTKDQRVVPAAQSLAVAIEESQTWQNGGYSHRPYPFIARRVAEGGPKGYGAMSGTAGLIMLAQSLFKVAGLDYSQDSYQRLHQGYLYSWTPTGYIDYGMKSWHHAVIEPTGDAVGKATNKKGIGYPIPTGMEGIDTFKLVWPTPDDNRGGPTDWLKSDKELAKAKVFLIDKNKLLVVRDMTMKEPPTAFSDNGKPIGHIFRTGTAAVAYNIAAGDDKVWKYMGQAYAKACANSPNAILDGHASTLMHTLWGSLGAAQADRKSFQKYMQGMKWWFVMAQTHDGSFVPMPGRDYASTDHVYAGRNFPTATAALILSVKDAKLQITGARSPHTPAPAGNHTAPRDDNKADDGPAPVTVVLGEDVTLKHCTREAELLNEGAPYAVVLRQLDAAVEQGGAHGKEAAYFGMQLRTWLAKRNNELIKQAGQTPARTLAEAREHARRLNGYNLPDANALRDKINELEADRDTKTLARYFEQLGRIKEHEARRGASPSTQRDRDQLARVLERFVEKADLPQSLKNEAKALQDELGP